MRRTGNDEETKRITMDLDVVLKSHDCPYIVQCLGCFITEADVWICMELMSTCFDKLQKRTQKPIPEAILRHVTEAVRMTATFVRAALIKKWLFLLSRLWKHYIILRNDTESFTGRTALNCFTSQFTQKFPLQRCEAIKYFNRRERPYKVMRLRNKWTAGRLKS